MAEVVNAHVVPVGLGMYLCGWLLLHVLTLQAQQRRRSAIPPP